MSDFYQSYPFCTSEDCSELCNALGLLFEGEHSQTLGRALFRNLVIRSNGQCALACYAYADCLWYGVGGERSEARAVLLYHISARHGCLGSMATLQYAINSCNSRGSLDRRTRSSVCSAKFFRELAFTYYNERCWFVRDLKRSFAFAQQGAMLGNADCAYLAGYLCFIGRGTIKNRAAATRWFAIGASAGHALCCERLGEAYWRGFGVNRDEVMAVGYHVLSTWLRGSTGELMSARWARRVAPNVLSSKEYERARFVSERLIDASRGDSEKQVQGGDTTAPSAATCAGRWCALAENPNTTLWRRVYKEQVEDRYEWDDDDRSDDLGSYCGDPDDFSYAGLDGDEAMLAWINTN